MDSHLHSSQFRLIPSHGRILLLAMLNAVSVLVAALALQWIIDHEWLHRSGPLRLAGGVVAAIVTFAFTYRCQCAARQCKLKMLHSFETIARANDRIRNALQAIACVTYFNDPDTMQPVLDAVDAIEGVLQEVLANTHPGLHPAQPKMAAAKTAGKS